MKKFIALTLASILLLVGITACGSSKEEAKDDKVLKIAGLDGGYGTKGWEAVAKGFEAKTGIKVELEFAKNISDVLRPRIQAEEDIPDIIYLAIGSTGGLTDTMVKERQIMDISSILNEKVLGEDTKVKDKIIEGFLNALTVKPYGDDKTYLMPINYSPTGLFYNAGLFKEKGWEVPKTWDEMWTLAEKAKAEGIALFTYPTTGYFDGFFSALLNEAVGPEKYEKLMNYDLATWESKEVKEVFDLVGKLATYTEANTVANANKDNYMKNQQLILDNKALFIPNGTWLPGEMKDAPRADGFAWGFTALPKLTEKGDAYATTFTEQFYIPSKAKNVDAAKQFMTYVYSDEAVKLFYEKSGAVIPIKKVTDLMSDTDENKLYYSIYEAGAKANAVGFAALENPVEGVDLTGAEGILYGSVNGIVSKSMTVDEWYKSFIDNLKKVVDANK